MSRQRLASTASFHAGRMIGVAVPAWIARHCVTKSGISLGECSVSSRIQSKPLSEIISAAILLHRLDHRPICNFSAASACLKALRCMSVMVHSYELDGDAAKRAEVGVQRVALLREYHAGERTG